MSFRGKSGIRGTQIRGTRISRIGKYNNFLYLAYKQLGKDYDEQEIHRLVKEEENIEFEINFLLYELLKDESYLETAYNQIQEKEDVMDDEQKEKFLSYPIPKQIIQEWERVS